MLFQQRGGLRPVLLRLRDLLFEASLPLPHRGEQHGPRRTPQDEEQQPEHDERPDDEPAVDGERPRAAFLRH